MDEMTPEQVGGLLRRDLSSAELAELERRAAAGEPPLDPDRVAGRVWTRDQVAAFWPCSAASVPVLAARHGIERVGTDPGSRQATYTAEDVVAARGSRPGQGARTDIRDNNLARTDTSVHYVLGRVVGALDVICDHHSATRHRGRTTAHRIQETGGLLTPVWLRSIRDDLRVTSRSRSERPVLDRLAREVIVELLPQVEEQVEEQAELLRQRPNQQQQLEFFTGYHHQRSTLYGAEQAAGR